VQFISVSFPSDLSAVDRQRISRRGIGVVSTRMAWSKELVGELQILLAAVLFGFAFVGSRKATEDPASPFTYNAWRFAVSAAIILPLRRPLKHYLNSDINNCETAKSREENVIAIHARRLLPFDVDVYTFDLYFYGILCGLSNFSMSTFLQYGLETVPVGKAAFINGLFVVVTPFLELILPGTNVTITMKVWFSVALSVAGTYLLSNAESSSIGYGELLVMMATISSSCNILSADAGSKRVDCVDLTCVEFSTTLILSMIPSLYYESELWVWPMPAFQQGWEMIVFVGVVEGAAFLISTIGQMHSTSNARSALIFSLEAVFTAILGYIFLGEALTYMEMGGCFLMFMATVISSESLDGEPTEAAAVTRDETTELLPASDGSKGDVELIQLRGPDKGSTSYAAHRREPAITASYGAV
jgi:drug/metabolite transporter (DMT)-like permease